MAAVVCIALLALLIKDTSFTGDTYILRGLSQGMSLVLGAYWFLTKSGRVKWRKYFGLLLFLFTISVGVIGARDQFYTGLQVASLGASCLLFTAYNESQLARRERNQTLYKFVLLAGVVVLTVSLAATRLWPSIAYYHDSIEGITRFRGLYGQPASMGSFAGIIVGVATFSSGSWWIRVPAIVLSLLCLAMTSSRTFWVAWLAATCFMLLWLAQRKRLQVITGLLFLLIIAGAVITAFDLRPSVKTTQGALRSDSIGNLTGRVGVWQYAFEKFKERPLLGYGFTTGDDAFKELSNTRTSKVAMAPDASKISTTRYSLHNGYIQALLDSGLIGAFLYLAILSTAIIKILATHDKQMAGALYVLIFVAVANMGESVMFSAAVFPSLLAWYFVVFGLSLQKSTSRSSDQDATPYVLPLSQSKRHLAHDPLQAT